MPICNYAEFEYEYGKQTCEIICNDKKIISLDIPFLIYKPEYFIKKNNKIFGILYTHKNIKIYNNMDNAFNEFTVAFDKHSEDAFDNIIITLLNKYGCSFFDLFKSNVNIGNIEKKEIYLSEYFEKGFFYRGTLWDMNWKKRLTQIKYIGFTDEILKIEIENLTYPHYGYILLEIEMNKIIECKKIL